MKKNWFVTFFFGWMLKKDLKTASETAILAVERNEDNVEAARLALANAQRTALENSERILAGLKTAQTEAEKAEELAETQRQKTIEDFDKKTDAEVKALERLLEALKTNRSNEKIAIETELAAERTEAGEQDQAATDAEIEIAARIEALRLGSDAQDGINGGLKS